MTRAAAAGPLSEASRRFLLSVLRDGSGAADPGPGWAALVEEARRQGLAQLLYGWARGSDERAAGIGPALAALRRHAFRTAARSLELSVELAELLPALGAAGIPCAPLRGPALAERLYGERTARPMGDLDLLVRRADLPRVRALLLARGYRELDRRPGFAERYSYTLEMYRERPPAVVVEPHWTIAYPPASRHLDMEPVWARAAPVTMLGLPALALSPADLLLHLCLHLAHADGAPLLWRYEIDRLIRQEAVDWDVLVPDARQAGVGATVRDALAGVARLFGTPVPAPALLALESRAAGLAERVARTSVDGRESLALLFELRGARARIDYALAILFPSPDFMRIHYGVAGRAGLTRAYLGRGCRLAIEAGRAAVRILRQCAGGLSQTGVC